MKVLVTGAAGFIGSFVARKLLDRGDEVVGLDNLSTYYDPALKLARLAQLGSAPGFRYVRLDLAHDDRIARLFRSERFERVVHLAAQAGVRYSVENPHAYVESNIVGFLHILEGCRNNDVQHLVYASTSSVYGANTSTPYSVHQSVAHPLSFYAATKGANELMAHSYSAMFGLPATGLRFFTVYGPWCRPDMAISKFTRKIFAGEPIDVYNFGRHRRDFTYVEDISEGVVRVLDRVPSASSFWNASAPDPATSFAPYRIYNIGNSKPVQLVHYIDVLERCIGIRAERNFLPLQPGDVTDTHADIEDLVRDVGYRPTTSVEVGIRQFVAWYREYYQV